MGPSKKENLLAFRNAIVVEPVAHLRQMTVGLLRNTTLDEIAMCSTPVEAIQMIDRHESDLVLCGSAHGTVTVLTEMLRRASDTPNRHVTIVALASQADYKSVMKARDNGVDTILAVPFSANTLARRLISLSRARPPFIEYKAFVGPDRRQQVKPIPHEDRRFDTSSLPAAHDLTCREILQRFIADQKKTREADRERVDAAAANRAAMGKNIIQDGKTLHLTAKDLQPDMVLRTDVVSKTGLTIVSNRTALSKNTILRLVDLTHAGEIEDFFQVEK